MVWPEESRRAVSWRFGAGTAALLVQAMQVLTAVVAEFCLHDRAVTSAPGWRRGARVDCGVLEGLYLTDI